MSSHHITMASPRNRHCIGRVHSVHPVSVWGCFHKRWQLTCSSGNFISKATWTYFTTKETFILKVNRDSGRYHAFNTWKCSAVTETITETKRSFTMRGPQKNICTSEAVGLSKSFLSVAFSLPPFLIFSAVDHVQIAVTCETDQWRGNLGPSIKDKRGHKIMMMPY